MFVCVMTEKIRILSSISILCRWDVDPSIVLIPSDVWGAVCDQRCLVMLNISSLYISTCEGGGWRERERGGGGGGGRGRERGRGREMTDKLTTG